MDQKAYETCGVGMLKTPPQTLGSQISSAYSVLNRIEDLLAHNDNVCATEQKAEPMSRIKYHIDNLSNIIMRLEKIEQLLQDL